MTSDIMFFFPSFFMSCCRCVCSFDPPMLHEALQFQLLPKNYCDKSAVRTGNHPFPQFLSSLFPSLPYMQSEATASAYRL